MSKDFIGGSFGPLKWCPYRWKHKRGGWFDGHILFLGGKRWVCTIGIFWAWRGDDFCINYARIKPYPKGFPNG